MTIMVMLAFSAAGCSNSDSDDGRFLPDTGDNNDGDIVDPLTVNSLQDAADPAPGTVTLRSALERAEPGEPIRFDESLDGGVIRLSIVGDAHTVLKGEVMGMDMTPSGPVS